MPELFDEIINQATILRGTAITAAQNLSDFKRRLELILSQDHREITIRDTTFQEEFAQFCQQLRKQIDADLDTWQQLRQDVRQATHLPSVLQAKSFALRTKTLSRASDELTTSLDAFYVFYKKYTLSKLPVWVLTSCCDDINNLSGKILFLAREISKQAGLKGD